jgi:subtilisin-like proprotein convertase family protein
MLRTKYLSSFFIILISFLFVSFLAFFISNHSPSSVYADVNEAFKYNSHIRLNGSSENSRIYFGKKVHDSDGNTYLFGHQYWGPHDLDPSANTLMSPYVHSRFVMKLDSSLQLVWVREWEENSSNFWVRPSDIALDSGGNVYLVADYKGTTDLDPTAGVDTRTSNGGSNTDALLIKFAPDGSVGFIKTWGSTATDYLSSITIDSNDNIYVGGYFSATTDFDPGAGTTTITKVNTNAHAYVSKFNSTGDFVWVKSFGTDNTTGSFKSTQTYGLVTDSMDNLFILGNFSGTGVDFDPGAGTDLFTATRGSVFLTRINVDGTYAWTKATGSTVSGAAAYVHDGAPNTIAIDSSDNIYVTGNYWGDPAPAYLNPDNPTEEYFTGDANSNLFLQKFNANGSLQWLRIFESDAWDEDSSIGITPQGNPVIYGSFQGKIDFDPTEGEDIKIKPGGQNTNGYITFLDSNGAYGWTHQFKSPNNNWASIRNISFNDAGKMYVTGYSDGDMIIPIELGDLTLPKEGDDSTFIIKYDNIASSNAKLSNIALSDGTLSPTFNANTNVYNVTLDERLEEISFNITAQDPTVHSITVNGTTVLNGQMSSPFTFPQLGVNKFTVQVTGSNEVSIKTYTIYIDNPDPITKNIRYCSNPHVEIPDNNPTGVSSTINVPDDLTVLNLSVYIDIYHKYTDEVSVWLSNDQPAGVSTQLVSSFNCGETDIEVKLTPLSSENIVDWSTCYDRMKAAYGEYKPDIAYPHELHSSSGNWTLTAKDSSNGDVGILNGWCVEFTVEADTPPEEEVGQQYSFDSFFNIYYGEIYKTHVDEDNNIYILAEVGAGPTDINPNGDPVNTVNAKSTIIAKYNSDQELLWFREWPDNSSNPRIEVQNFDIDSNNNVYLTGFYTGPINLDPTSTGQTWTSGGTSNAFFIKLNADSSLGFIKTWGATDVGAQDAYSVVVDSLDNVYVAGNYNITTDFNPGDSGGTLTNTTTRNHGYLVKYDSSGNFLSIRSMVTTAASGEVTIYAADVDNLDNIYLLGYNYGSVDFNPSGVSDIRVVDDEAVFLTKINSNGTYGWTKVTESVDGIGVYYWDEPYSSIAFDSNNNVYITGYYSGRYNYFAYLNPDNPTQRFLSIKQRNNVFIQKYATNGDFLWVKQINSDAPMTDQKIVVTPNDNIIYAGYYSTNQLIDFDPGWGFDIQSIAAPIYGSIYLSQMDSDGEYLGSNFITTNCWAELYDLFVDNQGSLYVSGYFCEDMTMNLGQGEVALTSVNNSDGFLLKLDEFVPSNVNLSSLSVSQGTLSPTFDPGVTSYTVNLATNQSTITLTPTADDPGVQSIVVNGTPVNSGSATAPLSLNEGSNVFSIVVTGSDGITTKTYTVTVSNPAPVVSEEVSIQDVPVGLKLKDAITGEDLTVSSEDNKGNGKRVRVYVDELIQDTLVAEVEVDIQEDLSWPDVKAGASKSEKKAFIKDLTKAAGTGEKNKLYVPKDGQDNKVRLCMNAQSLVAITRFCTPGIDLTVDDPNVTIVTDGGNEYWEIDDVEDVGGVSVYEPPVVPPSEDPGDTTPPPSTPPSSQPKTSGDSETTQPKTDESVEEPVDEDIDEDIEDDLVPVVTPPTSPVDTDTNDGESVVTKVVNSVVELVKTVITRLQSIGMDSTVTQTVAVGSFVAVATSAVLTTLAVSTSTSLYSLQLMSSLFFIKKLRKKGQNFGLVYDSVTKEPINRAIVRISDSNGTLVFTEVTDIYGIFDARLNTGSYKFSVEASGYNFPSRTITLKVDEPYMNVYHGELLNYSSTEPLNISIPLDRVDSSLVSESSASAKSIFMRFFDVSLYILFVVGFISTVFTLVNEPSALGWIMFSIYILFTIGYLIVRGNEGKKFGFVRNSSGSLVEGLELGLMELEFNQLAAKRVTDEDGKYRFIVPGGKYRLVVLNPGYELLESKNDLFEVKDGSVEVVKENIVVSKK